MAMVTLESLITSWLYDRPSEQKILSKIGQFVPLVLGFYFILRIGELYYKGHVGLIFDGSWEGSLFISEIMISTIIPIIFFSIKSIRESKSGLFIAATMVVLGFIFNRIDVGIISTFQAAGEIYFPSLIEILTSVGIVSIAMLVFLFFVENFSVYQTDKQETEESEKEVDIISNGRLLDAGLGKERRYSFVYILGASLAIFILPDNGLWDVKPQTTPVESARNIKADSILVSTSMNVNQNHNIMDPLSTTSTLLINGNRNDRSVLFAHDLHIHKKINTPNCGFCHHMNLTTAQVSQCSNCHMDMYLETDIFNHDEHISAEGGNKGCEKCHTDPDLEKNRQTSVGCSSCHQEMQVSESFITVATNWTGIAPGYMQAMHGLCLNCHEKKEKEAGQVRRTGISGCTTCHKEDGSKLYALTKPQPTGRKIR
jgi:hypothetical protein